MYIAMGLITIVLLYILYLRMQLRKTEKALRALKSATIVLPTGQKKSGIGIILAAGLFAFMMTVLANMALG